MKTFQYTVTGFIPYGNREVMAGDELDFPITSEIAGAPDTLRTVVLSVVDVTVSEVAGHMYDIQYDETLLGGNLLALDPCCDVGMPTAVTTDLLLEEHIASSPFIVSQTAVSDDTFKPSVRVTQATKVIEPNQDTASFDINIPYVMSNDLDIDDTEWDYLTEVVLIVRHGSDTDGNDSVWKGTAVSDHGSHATLAEQQVLIGSDTFISAEMQLGELLILVRNDSPLYQQRASLIATLTAFKR